MTRYEAEYVKQYAGRFGLITAKHKIADAVNCDWCYSMYWEDSTWVEQASKDVLSRLDNLEKEKNELHAALKILESIHSEEKCNNPD
jgi:hypothetical protein